MKFNTQILVIVCIGFLLNAHDASSNVVNPIVTEIAQTCSCGPAEHFLLKCCIKNYKQQFPDVALPENNHTEGLSENIVQAIAMIAADLQFVDADGQLLVPTLSAKGNLLVPMSKNADFKLIKSILHEVDVTTTLSAQELYEAWTLQLQAMKTAQ